MAVFRTGYQHPFVDRTEAKLEDEFETLPWDEMWGYALIGLSEDDEINAFIEAIEQADGLVQYLVKTEPSHN